MNNLGKLLAGAAAAAAFTASASAIDFANSETVRQLNWGKVYAITNLNASWLKGDLRASSTAVGNNMSITNEGSTWMWLTQVQLAEVGAEVHANVSDVTGDVDLSATGICNNIATATTKAHDVHVGSDQRCETTDPYATINAGVYNVGGNVSLASVAVANNASFTAESASLHVGAMQINPAAVNAVVNADISNVGGNVSVSATAIGNNVVVNHSFGGTP